MVSLPRTPLDNSVTQGSQSSVSGGEISSAFGQLAASMDELGQTFENAAVEKAGLEGQGAVYKDEKGNLKYDSKNPLSRAGVAFNRSARTAYVSQISMDARPAIANLEAEAKGDVQEFDKLSNAYVREMLKGKDPTLRGVIQQELASTINSSRTGMIRSQQNRDLQTQSGAITARITMANEDAAALARSGGTGTAEYAEQLDIIRTLEKEKVGNPLFAYSQAESDVFLRGVEGAHMAEAIVGQVETIYQTKGLKAAQDFANKSFDDPGIQLSPAERARYRNAAKGALVQFKAEMQVERTEAREDAKVLKDSLTAGQAVDDEDVYAVADRLSKSGDAGGAIRLLRQHKVAQQNAYFSQLPDAEQASSLASGTVGGGVGAYVNKIVMAESGGDPNARPRDENGKLLSSAGGIGQFLDSTWLKMINTYRPDVAAGKSDAEILSLRFGKENTDLGREMVKKFGEQNAASLTAAGFEATAGNIYLAHFLDASGAKTVLGSDGRTPISSLVSNDVLVANKFLRNMNVAELRSWANRKMGGPNVDPKTFAAMRKEVAADAKSLWTDMKAGLVKGDALSPDDLNLLGTQLGALGDKDFSDEVHGFLKQTGDYSTETLANMQKQMQEVESGGVSSDERDSLDMMRAVHAKTVEGLKNDPLELGRRIGMEGVKDIEPIDFTNPVLLGSGLGKNITAARRVAQRYGVDNVGVLTKNDAAAFKSIVATGDVKQASIAAQSITEVPDDLLRGTIEMPDVKDALIGMSQSRDFDKYGAAMTTMDKLYNRAPQEFARIFKGDTLDALQDWQGRLRYYNPVELEAEFKRRADPTYEAKRRELEKAGSALARKIKIDSIASDLGGPAPTDGTIAAALSADAEALFAQRYAATQDAATASEQTIARLKQHWGPSVTNNGELMLHPPDHYYPPIEGSYDWIEKQLNDDLVAAGFAQEIDTPSPFASEVQAGDGSSSVKVTKAWPHMLVADATTESEAAEGKPPSYRLMVVDPNTGYSNYATVTDPVTGKEVEMSIRFDNAPALGGANLKYSEQRKRYLDKKPLFGRSGGW